ncbi:putative oxidoreductase SadH [compost metagenome]
MADKDAVFAWADQVAAEHGKVNLIFNNAGVALGSPIDGGSYRDLEWVMNINFWGVVHGTKAFLPHLKKSGEGHIVNTSSMFGLFAVPSQSGYNASKFAVRGFTEALRQELELQRVNVSATCVHPGVINTGIAHAARMAPELRTLGMKADAISHFNRVPKISSDQAAEIIIRAVQSNKRRVLVGSDARLMDFLVRLMPARYQSLTTFGTRRFQ